MKKLSLILIILALCVSVSIYSFGTVSYADGALPPGLTSSSVGVGSGSTLASSTTQVGFGGLRWYVVGFNGTGLNKGAGTIALFSKAATGTSVFSTYSDSRYNDYSGSSLQTAVNSLLTHMDSREQAAMAGLTLDEVDGAQPTGQKIWALGNTDASTVSQDVRKLDNSWWIRSAGGYGVPIYVDPSGAICSWGAPESTVNSVRPGTAVNLSSVLYAAPIAAKGSNVGEMSPVDLSSEIKFTILDNTNLGLSIPAAPASLTQDQGTAISLDFSGAQTGTGKYVSCVLVSSDSLVKYYAKLSTDASGTLSIPVTPGIQAGNYTLLIYNEQVASGDNSDYACTPVSIALTVTGNTNSAPTLKTGVPSAASAQVSVGSAYTLNLADIFTDPDGNTLSYRVYVNGSGSATHADQNYSFTPAVAGTTTLRFTAYDGALESASYTVTLTAKAVAVTGITVTAENGATAIGKNGSLQLYYTVQPANATNKSITWTVTMPSVYMTGDIDAGNMLRTSSVNSTGTITVTAKAQDGSNVSCNYSISILSNPVTGITVGSATEDVATGESVQMSAAVTGGSSQAVTWSVSSGSGIASISADGLLSFSGSGTVTARATAKDGTGVFAEKTLTVKGIQSAPSAPTLSSKSAASVSLNAVGGTEYSTDGLAWQKSATFNGLTPNTAYSFYTRLEGTEALRPSPASPALAVTTNKASLGGSVSISGDFRCGQDLTAVTGGLTATPDSGLGALSYQWKRDGTNIPGATESTYSLVADDFGKVVNVTVSSSECSGSVSSANAIATGKGDPKYAVPADLAATYGDTLEDVELPAGFSWEDASTTLVGDAGSNSFTVAYTPSDTTCYNIVSGISVSIAVGKADPAYSAPAGLTATYGDTLEDVTLPAGFTWEDPADTSVGNVGTNSFLVTYTPSDTANYNTVTGISVSLAVEKADPSYSVPAGLTATVGDTLADVALPAGFAWEDPSTTSVGNAGTNGFHVTFTPADTANYNTITGISVSVAVGKADPAYSAPVGLTATYADTLADVTLPAGFSWEDPLTTSVGNAGTNSFPVTFTPSDTANYNTITGISVSVAVGKADLAYSAPAGLTATYGDTLADVTLPAGFAWEDPEATSVGNAGTNGFHVTFTPSDTANYNTVTGISVSIAVGKADPSCSAPAGLTATYGDTLADVALPAGFGWEDPSETSVGNAGTNSFLVTFTPPDTANYNTITGISVSVEVNKADPAYTAPTGLTAGYGDTLADVELPSGFTWEDPLTTSVGSIGDHGFTVRFTPSDTGNYNIVSGIAVNLSVGKANPPYAVPAGLAATYGDTLADVALPSGFAWEDPADTSVGNAGTNSFRATFTPSDTEHYNIITGISVPISVARIDPGYTAPASLAATYGDTLADVKLPSGFSWEDPLTTPVGNAGSNGFHVTFTPSDTVNYNCITGIPVTLTVGKAKTATTLSVRASGSNSLRLTATVVGVKGNHPTGSVTFRKGDEVLAIVALSGGEASYLWSDVAPGVYDFAADYAGNGNYKPSGTALTGYDVGKKAQESLEISGVPESVTYGDEDFELAVSGGSGDGDITFALDSGDALQVDENTGTVKVVGAGTCVITVTKAGDGEYNSETGSVVIQVQKAKPVIAEAPAASDIAAGSPLSASALTGGKAQGVYGETLEGSFAWNDPAQTVDMSGSYQVSFIPKDTGLYSAAVATVQVSVTKSGPQDIYVLDSNIVESGEKVAVDLTQGSSHLSADQISRLIALGSKEPVVLHGNGYEITFPAGSLSNTGESRDIDLGVTFNTGDDYDAVLSLAGKGFVLMLKFSYEGPLPGEAEIRFYVGKQYAGRTLFYQYYDPASGKLQLIQTTTVDANGYAVVKQSHCSTYVFTLAGESAANAEKPGGNGNVIWWLAGCSVCVLGAAAVAILAILNRRGRRKGAPEAKP